MTARVELSVPGYMPLKALAAYSGLSVRTLRTYLTHPAHPLPHFRIGGKILVLRCDYDVWAFHFRASVAPVVDDVVDDIMRSIL